MRQSLSLLIVLCLVTITSALSAAERGTADNPLRVILVPADGGTEDGTKADFEPVFNAITRTHGLHFTIRVGQSYGAVTEAMVRKQADIAFFGPLSYLQTRERGGAELLAVAVSKGQSIYYSALFTRADSGIQSVADVKGRSLALGDVNSTSSFAYPVAILIHGGVSPVTDTSSVVLAGTHANSLAALSEGRVDVCGASLDSYQKAVNQGAIDPQQVVVLARSEAILYPPITMHPELPAAIKSQLREAFGQVHQAPGIKPDMIRGYGGKRVDRYDPTISEEVFTETGRSMALIDDDLKAALIRRAADR